MRSGRLNRFLLTIIFIGVVLQCALVLESLMKTAVVCDYRDSETEYTEQRKQKLLSEITTKEPILKESDKLSLIWREKQMKRLKTLRYGCENTVSNYTGKLDDAGVRVHFILDEKNKLIYCEIPKVGSTFLKQVLHLTSGHRNFSDPFKISGDDAHSIPFKSLKTFNFDQTQRMLLDSKKFLFVRNPYARLLSAYIDKLFTINFIFWKTAGTRIIKKYRKHANKRSLTCGHDVKFEEFVMYVVDTEMQQKYRNAHWYPMYDACRPCNIPYDFIGTLETFKEDVVGIFNSLGLESHLQLAQMNEKNDNEAISLTIRRVLETLQKKQACLSLSQALERAWRVLQIRGVLSKKAKFPKKWASIKSITKEDAIKTIEDVTKQFPLSDEEKSQQKNDAMVASFKQISQKHIRTFQDIFLPDLTLFNYDVYPPGYFHEVGDKWNPFELKL